MRLLYILTGRDGRGYGDRLTNLLTPVLRPDAELVVRNIPDGPSSLEYGYQEAVVLPKLIDAIREAESDFDGVVIGCFLDPGIHIAREVVTIPVAGLGHSSLQLAASLGTKVGVLAGVRRLVPAIEQMIHGYGLDHLVGAIASTELTVADMREDGRSAVGRVDEVIQWLADQHYVDVIIGGCGSLGEIFEEMRPTYPLPLIDARIAAVKHLEMLVDLYAQGFAKTSKAGLYEMPPARAFAPVG